MKTIKRERTWGEIQLYPLVCFHVSTVFYELHQRVSLTSLLHR